MAYEKIFNTHNYGYEIYNYMDGATLGTTDDYYIDGFHGSDVVYGLIIEDMASYETDINSYIDLEKTEELLENRYNGMVFYNPDIKK